MSSSRPATPVPGSAGEPHRLVGQVLDVAGRGLPQFPGQFPQRPGDSELIADRRHLAVVRVAVRHTRPAQVRVFAGTQPRLGPGRPLVLVLVDVYLHGPPFGGTHRDHLPVTRLSAPPRRGYPAARSRHTPGVGAVVAGAGELAVVRSEG